MKIRDKIKKIYQLYEEYYWLLSKRSKELKGESIKIDLFTLSLFDQLAISYFNSYYLGMVISCYCYNNIFVEPTTELYTIYRIMETTESVVEWYRNHYDSEIKVEDVVQELKRMIEREEELEKRTKMLERFYNNGGYRSVGNLSSEEIIVGLEKMMFGEEDMWGSK